MSSSTSGPHPAHPAFPALIPSHLAQNPVAPSVPTTSAAILKLIESCKSPHDISSNLIPSLAAVVAPKKGGDKDKEKEKASSRGEEILAAFDQVDLKNVGKYEIQEQSAGLVFILSARMHPNHTDHKGYNADLLSVASDLCSHGNVDQLKQCGPRLSDLAWGMIRLSKHLRTPDVALPSIQSLLRHVIPPACLSGVHAAFLEGCLLSRQYDAAQPYINDIFVDVKLMSPSYLDVITFYHHAGLISAAVQKWDKAVEMFTTAVTVPTAAASAIQLSCAKRAILCGLLNDGKLVHFPKYISGPVSRIIERNAKEYVRLAEAFSRGDWGVVRGFLGAKDFKDDYNVGLLDQIIGAIPIRQIIQIKTLYSRMSLSDLAKRLDMTGESGEQDVSGLLDYMTNRNIIRATRDDSNGTPIISFMEDNIDYTSPGALGELRNYNRLAEWLGTELTRSGRELGVHREYLKKQSQNIDGAGKGALGKGDDSDGFSMMGGGFGGMGGGGGGSKGKMRGVGSNMADTGF